MVLCIHVIGKWWNRQSNPHLGSCFTSPSSHIQRTQRCSICEFDSYFLDFCLYYVLFLHWNCFFPARVWLSGGEHISYSAVLMIAQWKSGIWMRWLMSKLCKSFLRLRITFCFKITDWSLFLSWRVNFVWYWNCDIPTPYKFLMLTPSPTLKR